MSNVAVVWLVMGPLLGAVVTYLAGRRGSAVTGVVVALSVVAAAAQVAAGVAALEAPLRYPIGGWAAPLGIALHVDGLGAFFLLMTATIGLAVSVYSLAYFPRHHEHLGHWQEQEAFWPLWLTLWGAMNAVFISADLFNVYVGLEVMTLAAVALVTLTGQTVALTAAMRYLLASLLSSLAYLLGVAMIYALGGTLDMHLLTGELERGVALWMAMGLMVGGLLIKTAIFPMHFWLPGAHSSAPAPVSAVLSAVVVKVSFFLILRLWFGPLEAVATEAGATLLALLGAAAVLWGSLQALRQRRLKMLIAYSTVAQLGYLMLILPLTMASTPTVRGPTDLNFDAWSGGMYQVLSHALAKAAMFLAAGAVMHSLGHDRIVAMRGVVARMPLTSFTFGIAGVSLIGLPPTSGFIAKWFLLNASIESGQWWWGVVLLVGGLLAAMYVFRIFLHAFLPAPQGREFSEAPPLMTLPALGLALAALMFGLRASEPFALLELGAPFLAPVDPEGVQP